MRVPGMREVLNRFWLGLTGQFSMTFNTLIVVEGFDSVIKAAIHAQPNTRHKRPYRGAI